MILLIYVFLQDNIVCLPPKLAQILGNISPICICSHVTQTVHLIDPNTLQGQLFIGCYNDSNTSNCPSVFVKLVDQIVIYTVRFLKFIIFFLSGGCEWNTVLEVPFCEPLLPQKICGVYGDAGGHYSRKGQAPQSPSIQ